MVSSRGEQFVRFALALGLLWLTAVSAGRAADKPNIVLVMADDQGWGDMAYNGHPAQQNGGDLQADESSRRAAELPKPAYPVDRFAGHAAWIDGDWKLHRKATVDDTIIWELYNLADDPQESANLADTEATRVQTMREQLDRWLQSVARSLNGGPNRARPKSC
jgi:arylsulfatase A-like enzyme